MNFSNELLFFFSALGVFNALLISLYFFFYKKPKTISNFFFGFMLLMFAIRVGKSVFFYFNPEIALIYIKIGLSACVLIGPSLFFYIKSVIHKEQKSRFWVIHFILLIALTIWVGFSFTETFNPHFGSFTWLDIIYSIWMFYILVTAYLLKNTIKKIFIKNDILNGLDFWLLSIFMGNLIIWIAYNTVNYTSYIVGALSFSFIFYLLFLLIYFNRKEEAIFNKKEKYSDKKINTIEAVELTKILKQTMVIDKLYIDANLKLQDVAKYLNIVPHRLSQLMNDNLNKNFTSFINEYRINEAKKLIQENDKLTLEAIGYECGFNSKSTFYSAFKKHSGTTPSKFKSQIKHTDL